MLHNVPQDLNAEILLDYLPKGSCQVEFGGFHSRNTYHDLVSMTEDSDCDEPLGDGRVHLQLGRGSLYDSLPEILFHPIDRFDHLSNEDPQAAFEHQLELQKKEIHDAHMLFAPLDAMLLQMRLDLRKELAPFVDDDHVIQNMLADRLTPQQKANPLIQRALPYLPLARNIRGNRLLITMLLRKIFKDENLRLEEGDQTKAYNESRPRFFDRLPVHPSQAVLLGQTYLGGTYEQTIHTYTLTFWSEEHGGTDFPEFYQKVEQFRAFIQDFFISVECELQFFLENPDENLRLADTDNQLYLNFNTNL